MQTTVITNPIRTERKLRHRTIKEMADQIGIHPQALYLAECGCYPRILPAILKEFGWSGYDEQADAYRAYQNIKRQVSGDKCGLSEYKTPAPIYTVHPVVLFRTNLPHASLSRMMFCKMFCIPPAELYSLEHGHKQEFSQQFREAMQEAGLEDTVLSELEYRSQEYALSEQPV